MIALFSCIKKRLGCLVFIFINNPGINEAEETVESFVFVRLFVCFVSSHIQVLSVIKKGLMKMFPRAV